MKTSGQNTYHNKKDKINPRPEGVSILYVIHYVRPAFEGDDQKDRGPCHANIVERERILERILLARPTLRIVLVPIDTARIGRLIGGGRRAGWLGTGEMIITGRRQIETSVHAIILVHAANVVLVSIFVLVIRGDRALVINIKTKTRF